MCSTATTDSGLSLNTYRRSRTKTRKPKFLSLQQELSAGRAMKQHHQHHLSLFPLHPENLNEEKDMHDNVANFFGPDGSIAATTLTGLLGAADMSSSSSAEVDFSPPSSYSAVESDGGSSLERAALRRRRECDVSEEKWVVYSDVATKEKEEEERYREWPDHHAPSPGLALKLDYQHILNAWSDKGSLYIEGEGGQIVPDIQAQDSASVYNMEMAGGCMGNERLWRVPDEGSSAMEEAGGVGKMRQREAKVLRYKEKRQSRLFSKRIRYEVRKLNAEKRPRMKGRFVKRKADA